MGGKGLMIEYKKAVSRNLKKPFRIQQTCRPVRGILQSVVHFEVFYRATTVPPLAEVQGGVGGVGCEELELRGLRRRPAFGASLHDGGW